MNRLAQENSPYLRQHSENPVEWYAWGPEAFKAARDQNKPIFLSIGYSTCYWCHVMEKDSFEIAEVAEHLNKSFISIKVDREERPDVDGLYMDAVVGLTGRGGWPMSVFLTPDLKPFWGATYIPRAQFISVLTQLSEVWLTQRDKVELSAGEITRLLEERAIKGQDESGTEDPLQKAFQYFKQNFDARHGGFGDAPKFPPPHQVSLLYRIARLSGNASAREIAEKTLCAMARGGIYDHLGGGFSRYSTDAEWLVPHFEKMLYDNALLAFSYLEAFQVSGDPLYASVARETLDFVLREMTDAAGGFYSALDAGEVGKEGEYYVWTSSEIAALLGPEENVAFCDAFGVTPAGNFEHGTNVLSFSAERTWQDRDSGLLASARRKLLEARQNRAAPARDNKIIAAWNGLMISAFAKGSDVLGEGRYLAAAQQAVRFLEVHLIRDGKLLRSVCNGAARIDACLEDYAFTIEGLLNLHQADCNSQWMDIAAQLQQKQDQLFWDTRASGYFVSAAPDLIIRKKDYLDNATPTGNSVALLNLSRLARFYPSAGYDTYADELVKALTPLMESYPHALPRALWAMEFIRHGGIEVCIVEGDNSGAFEQGLALVRKKFLPALVLAAKRKTDCGIALPLLIGKEAIDGRTTFYVCVGKNCLPPTSEVGAVENILSKAPRQYFAGDITSPHGG